MSSVILSIVFATGVQGAPAPSRLDLAVIAPPPVSPGPGPKASAPQGWWRRGPAACGPGERLYGGWPAYNFAVCQDAQRRSHGPHVYFDRRTGTCLERGEFRHGKRHGIRIQYHPNGLPKRLETHRGGRLEGRVVEWHPSGRPRSEVVFRGYRLDGRYRAWHPSGQLAEVGWYRQGKPAGPRAVTFHANGRRKEEIEYQGGLLHGTRSRYYPSGRRQLVERYAKGLRHGLWASWHPGGQRATVAGYEQGRPSGLAQRWDPRGRLLGTVRWLRGRVVAVTGAQP